MIAVISALEGEIRVLRTKVNKAVSVKWNERTITRGFFAGNEIVLAASGVGKVNAALCTQFIIDRYEVDAIIFTGIAGGVNPSLSIGDIVVAKDCIQWDIDVRTFGLERGALPLPGNRGTMQVFTSDETLTKNALAWSPPGGKITPGRILTGDSFVSVKQIRENPSMETALLELKGDAVEMEGAAAAQVCHENGIPFLLVRVISDTLASGSVKRFAPFLSASSKKISSLIAFILKGQNDV